MATKTLSLRIDEELIERIDALVGNGQSRNAVIKDLIEAGLDAKSGKKTDEEMLREMLQEFLAEAKGEISEEVSAKVTAANNELYRDQSQQLTAQLLPAVLGPLLEEQKKQLTEEIDARMPALPASEDPQPEIEGSATEPVAAETQTQVPETKSTWQRFKDWWNG